ncbi:MAG: S28 family serine protease [Bacteroidota bacterium]
MRKLLYAGVLVFSVISFSFQAMGQSSVSEFLERCDDVVSIEKVSADSLFEDAWILWVEQPLDHDHPEKGSFRQRVWLSHRSIEVPVVMVNEGYMAPRNYTSELAGILKANQVIVEHRYFGQSVPDSIDWKHLTIEQSARDHHRIVEMLKPLYDGKWVNSGISKGGQTAMIHRAFFPDDVDVTVAYVAPFNLEKEDERLIDFFDQVGTPQQREDILAFQKEVLKRKDELMPMFKDMAENQEYTFRMGLEKAFELVVLEYPFSLWQWCGPVDHIPEPGVSAEKLFSHLQESSDFGYFSDQQWEDIGPFFYQAYKELGYYPYLATPVKPWLEEIEADTVSSKFMTPRKASPVFENNTPVRLLEKLRSVDPEMIVITGENDPWSATSLNTEGFEHVLKVEKAGGCHDTRIRNLPDSLKQRVINHLDSVLYK